MKRNLIGILSLVALALLLNAASAYAQAFATANVPFDFKVGKAQLPAGSYVISTDNPNTIVIHNRKSSAGALSIVRHEYPRNKSPRLVFHRVGDQYFLAEVWGAAGSDGMTIPASKLEKELMASGPSNAPEEIVIALNR